MIAGNKAPGISLEEKDVFGICGGKTIDCDTEKETITNTNVVMTS